MNAADRIQKLPSHMLPLPHCSKGDRGKPKPASRVAFQLGPNDKEAKPISGKKRVRASENESSSQAGQPPRPPPPARPAMSAGLAKTVQELIRSYVPASLEKKAFYCRSCQHQAVDEEEFFAHRETPSHLEAADLERKASFCRLCRKQFTSPEQIKEHLKGKAHKLKMEATAKNNQRGNKTTGGVKLDRI
jgi:hypothetical protein